ncbi:MAG: AAA family ATPase [Candidatus Micrarchaeia archaeon]|jgi:exonuclease SbcC
MITSIHLFNWKSHKETLLEFSKGTNVLIGIMGSGKSSVLDAISFGLYGTCPSLKRGSIKLENILKYGENQSKIIIKFIHEDIKYEIERTLSKNGSDAVLYKEGQMIQKSPKAVTTEIEKILNVDYELFNKIIYSEQNNIDYFFSLRAGKRKEEIDNLLGLDKFETARINVTKIINKIKDLSSFLKENINFQKENELNEKIKQIEEEIQELNNKKQESLRKYSQKKKEFDEIKQKVTDLEKQKKDYQELKELMLRKEEIQKRLIIDLDNLDKYKELNLEEKRKELDNLKIGALEDKINILLKQNNELISKKSKISSDIERIQKIDKQILELRAELENINGEEIEKNFILIEEKLENIKKHISKIELRKKDLEKAIKELDNKELSKCPICDSQLSEEHRLELINEKKREKEEIGENETKAEKEKQEIKAEKEKQEKNKKQFEKQKEKLEELLKEVKDTSELKTQLNKLEEEGIKIAEEKTKLDLEIKEKRELKDKLKDEIRFLEEYTKKSKEKIEIEEELEQKRLKLKQIEYNEDLFNKLNKEIQEKNIEFNKLEYEIKTIDNELKNKNEIVDLNKKEIEKINKLKSDIEYFAKKEEQYSIYKNCIIETQTEVRKGLIEAINTAMMEIWPIIYPYGDYEKVRLDPQEKDYITQLYRNNEWHDLDATASGGEKACLSLTLRIAFAMVLTPNLSWLILDEPTHNLDVQAVKMLSETLQEKIPEIVEQTFVITHDESLLNHDFNALYKLERDKSKNEPTQIERVK